jgi:hypothetical protein
MTIFFYPLEDDQPPAAVAPARQAVQKSALSIYQAMKAAEAEDRRTASDRTRVTTFRIPVELLCRLDQVANDAATSRGHLLRQIIAEYITYVEEHNIRYKGSLLSSHAPALPGRVRALDDPIVL